jgi:hypothetical protein
MFSLPGFGEEPRGDAADTNSRGVFSMTLGTSLFMIAVGAILKYAVTATVAGIDLHVAGVVLMVVGVVGLIVGLALFFAERPSRIEAPPVDPAGTVPPRRVSDR